MGIFTLIFFVSTCWLAWDKYKNTKLAQALRIRISDLLNALEVSQTAINARNSELKSVKNELADVKTKMMQEKSAQKSAPKKSTKRAPRKKGGK